MAGLEQEIEKEKKKLPAVVHWSARVLGLVAFLFWGAFFVEHLQWFARPSELPPARVIIHMFYHLAMLLGFLAALKWELAGGLVMIAASGLFFIGLSVPHSYLFWATYAIPALLFIASWKLRRAAVPPPAPQTLAT
ncbi:MAG: hypothetical protein V1794_17120 [Candidatus Glassbacteria bacterium]